MPEQEIARLFVDGAQRKLEQDAAQIARCVGLLDERQLWQRANEHCNSVGNLVLHLTGNLRQWILGGVAGHAVLRNREAEFTERGPLPAAQIMPPFARVVDQSLAVFGQLTAAALIEARTIQNYPVSALIAVFHVVEHVSFHTGQIVQITKELLNVDLSLYDDAGQRRHPRGFP